MPGDNLKPMEIRTMVESDAARVRDLSEQLGYPMSLEDVSTRVRKIVSLPEHKALVAIEDGVVVGWLHCFVSYLIEVPHTFVEIGGLIVDEGARGTGVGHLLVAAAESWTREQGHSDIRVRSASHRAGAHEFYHKLGFTLLKTQMRFVKSL